MEFTANRKILLAGFGHALAFEKGETKFVPPVLRQMAMAEGLDPVVAEGEDVPTKPSIPDEEARRDAVRAGMKAVAERNRTNDFDASGTPKVAAIEAASGGAKPSDNKERLALWAQVVADVGND